MNGDNRKGARQGQPTPYMPGSCHFREENIHLNNKAKPFLQTKPILHGYFNHQQ